HPHRVVDLAHSMSPSAFQQRKPVFGPLDRERSPFGLENSSVVFATRPLFWLGLLRNSRQGESNPGHNEDHPVHREPTRQALLTHSKHLHGSREPLLTVLSLALLA